MERRPVKAILFLVFSLFVSSLLPIGGVAANAQSEADRAAQFAYDVSVLESQGNFDRIYDVMHPDARTVIPRSAVVGWYRTDFAPQGPQPISEITAVRTVSWAWPVTGVTYPITYEIDFVQPFINGSGTNYVSETVRIVPTSGGFGWFFGRSREFVDAQIARFPATEVAAPSRQQAPVAPPVSITFGDTPAALAAQSTPSCTLVELYPGYPGYRGNITGLLPGWLGQGDYECLQTLQTLDPRFDKASVDLANSNAARALGITGTPDLWTWENWLRIEAQLGRTPTCYSCLMLSPSVTPRRPEVGPAPNDARILTGFSGKTVGINTITTVTGHSTEDLFNYDDYILRAEAYMSGGASMNAPQLYNAMVERVNQWFTPNAALPDVGAMLHYAVYDSGGYSIVPPRTSSNDQLFLMTYAVAVFTNVRGEPTGRMAWNEFQQSFTRWQSALVTSANPPTLQQFMQSEQFWQVYAG